MTLSILQKYWRLHIFLRNRLGIQIFNYFISYFNRKPRIRELALNPLSASVTLI